MLRPRSSWLPSLWCGAWLLLAAEWSARPATAAEAAEDPVDRELRFIGGLVEKLNLPDHAEKRLDALLFKHPEAKAKAGPVRIKIFTAGGKFDKARDLIAALPPDTVETMGMTLALGDAYYAYGKMAEARAAYDAFFKKYPSGPPAELAKFYTESAYKYVQMLTFMGDLKAAIKAYDYILLAKPDKEIERRVQTEAAELALRYAAKVEGKEREEYLDKARTLAMAVQWGDPDLWFGKSVVTLAHIDMARGNRKAARKTIESYLPILKDLDAALKANDIPLKFSPMAECRFLMGSLYEEEGRALIAEGKKEDGVAALVEALKHFYNVFVKYPASPWAPDAGARSDRLKSDLEAMGKAVQMPKIDMRPIVEAQLKEAKALLAQQDFKSAAEKYVSVLNIFPENEGSVTALGELGQCYVQLHDPIYARMVMGHISSRFSRHPNLSEEAGQALLSIGESAESINDRDLSRKAYDLFFEKFPGHKRAAPMLYRFGEAKFAETNYDLALGYYQQVATQYTNSPVFVPALNRIALCYSLLNDQSNAVEALTRYIAELQPGPPLVDGVFRLAESLKLLGRYVPAINEYARLVKMLTSEPNKYARVAEDVARNKLILERAMFAKAFCYSKLKEPADKLPMYQQKAIEDYGSFLAAFPRSPLAPLALSRMGTLLQVTGKADEASKIFDRLTREYPDSEEAKDVVFVQGMGLIELGQMDKAVAVFERMFAKETAFTAAQFLRVGRIMADAGQYETALRFYEQAKKSSPARETWEPAAFGAGEAYAALGNPAATIRAFEELLQKYENTGYTVPIGIELSKAYAEMGSKETDPQARFGHFDKAIKALKRARSFTREPDLRAQADIRLAEVQMLMGAKDEALATYVRTLLLGDANNPKVRPYLEQAFEKSVPLLQQTQRYRDIVDSCEMYLDAFPNGRLATQARQWRDEARLKTVMGAPAPGGSVAPDSKP